MVRAWLLMGVAAWWVSGCSTTCTSECIPCSDPKGCGGTGATGGGGGAPTLRSTFDSDVDGWTIQGFATDAPTWNVDKPIAGKPMWDLTGDPGGAVLRKEAILGESEYFTAPASYVGDRSAYYGGTLTFEVRSSDTMHPFVGPMVMLNTVGQTLLWNAPDAQLVWTPYSVRLDTSGGWTRKSDGAAANEVDLRAALGDLTALWIRGEFSDGSDSGWLDNVVLSP